MATYRADDFLVSVKSAWNADWTSVSHLYPEVLVACCSPEIPKAEFGYDYGRIARHGETSFDDYAPLSLKNYYIWCRTADLAISWIGLITDVHTEHGGDDVSNGAATVRTGRQTLTAYGLEHLLDRAYIAGGLVEYTSGLDITSTYITNTPCFNRRATTELAAEGNRSIDKRASDPELDPSVDGSYVFSRAGRMWTRANIIEYLLRAFGPTAMTWRAAGQITDLDGADSASGRDVVFDPSGMTVLDALRTIVDRRRGYTFFVSPSADKNGEISVVIRSLFSADVSVAGRDFKKSASQSPVDVSSMRDVTCETHRSSASECYAVVAEGERVKVCFSVSIQDGTLEPAWTDDEEDAYKAGASGATGYNTLLAFERETINDMYRKSAPHLRRAFAKFRIPPGWDWLAGCGEGGPMNNANPQIDADGSPDFDEQSVAWDFYRPILSKIPLLENTDYSVEGFPSTLSTDAEPEYRPPFVVLQGKDGLWRPAHASNREDSAGAMVRPVPREMALHVQFDASHRLALNHWDGAQPSAIEPEYDYEQMIATICIETDERLFYNHIGGQTADSQQIRTIHVPGAEMWILMPGTVVGISDDGTLQRVYGAPATPIILRSDADKLNVIARLAYEFAAMERRAVILSSQCLRAPSDLASLGAYITTLTTGTGGAAETLTCNSIVTRVTHNFTRQTTQIVSDWWDVDWTAIAPVNHPSIPSARALASKLADQAVAAFLRNQWGAQ